MTGCSHHSCRVRLVDHHQRVVFFSQIAYFIYRRHVPVHRKHAVGANNTKALRLCFFQTAFQICHIGVGIAIAFGLAQPYAVDNRSVVQRI